MQHKTSLLFGIHMHQPVDNFDYVIDHAVEVCYAPFFEVMSRYPGFRFSVHCSGWLLEQIEERFPALFGTIVELAGKGSIEFFSAGYYEPILSVIPSEDRVEQITRLSRYIEEKFSQTPKGLWLTERVWESSVIPDLRKSGIDFCVIDDYHFESTGFDKSILDGYFLSEEGGETAGLFPISKKLRYALPFLSVPKAIEAIRSFDRTGDSAAIIFDDAEKFGMWPGTHEWVYEKGWLEKFVSGVLADGMIETMHYSEYFTRHKPRSIAYLPNLSYFEMSEWSLGADNAAILEKLREEMGFDRFEREGIRFIRGGIWKNFFVKYPESNRIHKRMLELSRVRKEVQSSSFDEWLYKAQTNDALWHGVFGGLYLPNLRDNAWHFIIEAEKIRYGGKSLLSTDHNELDGYTKIKAVTPLYLYRFDGRWGGQLVEFDSLADGFNWQNTLTRRKELYHQKVLNPPHVEPKSAEDDGIDTIHTANLKVDTKMKDALIYDWHLKNSLIDHISDHTFTLENFHHARFREYGDFANQPFEASCEGKSVEFFREGGIYMDGRKFESVMRKRYEIREDGFDFDIALKSECESALRYALEFNLHFADYDGLLIDDEPFGDAWRKTRREKVVLRDGYTGKVITIALEHEFDLYCFGLETLSQSEKGFDLTTQAVSLALAVPFRGSFALRGSLRIHYV